MRGGIERAAVIPGPVLLKADVIKLYGGVDRARARVGNVERAAVLRRSVLIHSGVGDREIRAVDRDRAAVACLSPARTVPCERAVCDIYDALSGNVDRAALIYSAVSGKRAA
jgi:hypothetical protein